MATDWITTRLQLTEKPQCLAISDAYKAYREDSLNDTLTVNEHTFYASVRKLFPLVTSSQVRRGGKRVKIYTNVCIISGEANNHVVSLSVIYDKLCSSYDINSTPHYDELTVIQPTDLLCNGKRVDKIVTINENGTVTMSIGSKILDMNHFNVANTISLTVNNVIGLLTVVKALRICTGVEVQKVSTDTKCWCVIGDENKLKLGLNAKQCHMSLQLNGKIDMCPKCKNLAKYTKQCESKAVTSPILQSQPKSEHAKETQQDEPEQMTEQPQLCPDSDSCLNNDVDCLKDKHPNPDISPSSPACQPEKEDLMADLRKILAKMDLPNITASLILNQASNSKAPPRLRRWDTNVILVCLSWWACDPKTYRHWREKVAVLPHPVTLRGYKNCLQQSTGLNDEMLKWMRREADKNELQPDDRCGGLILDEMSIQDDLQVVHKGCNTYYSGMVEMTPDAQGLRHIRTGSTNITLASHVLQFVFLGNNGFRWPFAHFGTAEAQGPEIFMMFWEAIDKLHEWGFTVEYTCLDGAISNRHFVNVIKSSGGFFAKSLLNADHKIAIIMDIKHGIKKIRNGILSSGTKTFHTRLLKPLHLGQYEVKWEHWIATWQWDSDNHSLPLYQKLTREHLFLDSKSKMRNSLAEQTLNHDMLRLMQDYQTSLGPDGNKLAGSIALLERTSVLVDFSDDFRYITGPDDFRLKKLRDVNEWFEEWEKAVQSALQGKAAQNRCLLSSEARQDLKSTVYGLGHLCEQHFKNNNRSLCPARLNSDVVENVFCQQRALQHGANDNPNLYQYGHGITTLILTQPPLSRKRNSAGTVEPLNMTVDVKEQKKRCKLTLPKM